MENKTQNAKGNSLGCGILLIIIVLIVVFAVVFGSDHHHYSKTLDPNKVEIETVMSGSGTNIIGKRGTIYIKPKNLNKLSYKEIKTFMNWVEAQRGKLNWVTIDLGNGYGFIITGCNPETTTYGELDDDGTNTSLDQKYLVDKGTYYLLCDYNEDKDTLVPLSSMTFSYGINGLADK